MNKKLLFACLIISGTSFGQQQIGNADMGKLGQCWFEFGGAYELV